MAPDYASQRAIGPGRMRSGKLVLRGSQPNWCDNRISKHEEMHLHHNTSGAGGLSQETAKTARFLRDTELFPSNAGPRTTWRAIAKERPNESPGGNSMAN